MKFLSFIAIILLVTTMVPGELYAQEEESAAISLAENTDVFQELFFEALKQKGIENYGKAINALLKCKQMEASSDVVDHELAKTYKMNNQLVLAEQSAREAIIGQPENLWYLYTLLEIMELQGSDLDRIKDQIPYDNAQLKENLAQIYFEKKRYDRSSEVLKELRTNKFTKELAARINDSLQNEIPEEKKLPVNENIEKLNPVTVLINELTVLIENEDFATLNQKAEEALENYPTQPFFYYANGMALNRMTKNREAVDVLTMGLDFIIENNELLQTFYVELARAHNALGETTKANTYLSKIKNGS
jgi:predicted Zn-dependent protease